MGLILGLMLDPVRVVFLAFLLAASLELETRTATRLMLGVGAILFAWLIPAVFSEAVEPGRFFVPGIISTLLLLALFYALYSMVLRRLAN